MNDDASRPSLSLCMIVKNEADWIWSCLQSVQSIISEAIVVDTGSTDETIELARRFGAAVFEIPWEDDFAKARNFSLSKATSDWILVLDADEQIAKQDLTRFPELMTDRSICSEFLQRHYTNDVRLSDFIPCLGQFPLLEEGHAGYFESNCVRLFPNHQGLEFRGRVHELVEHSIYERKELTIIRTSIRIHHYGHTDKVKQKKSKNKLYSPLGEQKVLEESTNWKAFFELGVEHNVNGKREESIEAFRRSIELNPNYVDSWVNMGYAQMELGRYPDALTSFEKAVLLDPQCANAYCNMSVVGMRTENLQLAEMAAVRALSINPKYANAATNLARTYAMARRDSEAVLLYKYALSLVPSLASAKADLGALYLRSNLHETAIRFLKETIAENNKITFAWFNLGMAYQSTGRAPEALNAFRHALALDPLIELPPSVRGALSQHP